MKIVPTPLEGLLLIEPRVFEDDRGFFMETFHQARFREAGLPCDFVQENHSRSQQGVLRGLHYQIKHPQGKLIRVVRGEVFDVAVDLRRGSPTFGRWFGVRLSEWNRLQLFVPPKFAHGFCVLSEMADVVYSCTDLYFSEHERVIAWNDPAIGIAWPIASPRLSPKDERGLRFSEAPVFD